MQNKEKLRERISTYGEEDKLPLGTLIAPKAEQKMKIERTILALVGLAAIALAYLTGDFYFLILAVVVFFVGLYAMRAARRSGKGNSGGSSMTTKDSKRKDKKQD